MCIRDSVRAVPWVKADDIVVALNVLPFLVLAIAEIGAHTGNGKILPATIQRGYKSGCTNRD